jgi:hypothetical protein
LGKVWETFGEEFGVKRREMMLGFGVKRVWEQKHGCHTNQLKGRGGGLADRTAM